MGNRDFYVDQFRYWFRIIDRGWDDVNGLYVPDDAGSAVHLNASMLPCLVIMGLEGDGERARRIPRIIEHLLGTPPWDPEYHYWNARFDRLGMVPHAGMFEVGACLSMVYMYRKELDLPIDLLERAMDDVQLLTAKMAEAADRAGELPFNCYIDTQGNVVDARSILREAVRSGVPADLRWLREGGPSNQLVELWVASQGYLATGREPFWDHARRIWRRIIEREEDGKAVLYRNSIDPDYSFVYETDPQQGVHSHRYTQSIYASAFLILHSSAVRIARKVGRAERLWEEMIRRTAQAVFGRTLLLDGNCNMVFNAYGWERSITANYVRACHLQPLISLADLTPFTPGQLVNMVNTSLRTLREWHEQGRLEAFPPVLGLKGYHRGGAWYTAQLVASALCQVILTDREAMEVEEDPRASSRCYSGFAWEQKHFVMQTPSYSLTVVGAGTPYMEGNGYLGTGMIVSGGEYVIKLPHGPFLTPLSDAGRALLCARVAGEDLSSSDVHFFNQRDCGLRMEVILPDGTRIARGEDYGPSPYDPELENVSLEVHFEKNGVRLGRRFDSSPTGVVITDSIEALEEVEIERCFSRLPVITVDPVGDSVVLSGMAGGRPVEIKPPCHMGYAGDLQHYDRDFVQSVPDLERVEASYPSGYGFVFERLDTAPVKVVLTRGEWQENRHMRVDGKNIDYYWVSDVLRLKKGETRSFSYRITPMRCPRKSGTADDQPDDRDPAAVPGVGSGA
ncbi:MAG: hypothetical protein HYY08_03715 [Firmicutes bacterium]|nr:hypothetical protein [Bacillota bacterium]